MSGASESELPRRLNLGCGFDRRAAYLNVDRQAFHRPDLIADVRDLSSLPDAYFDEILAIHVLEHLPRADTGRALAEWRRVLATGGTVHIQVPDVVAVGQLLMERDRRADHEVLLHHLYGTPAYDGDFHVAGFTDRALMWLLHEAGFESITTYGEQGWLLLADALKAGEPTERSAARSLGIGYSPGFYSAEPDGIRGSTFRWCQSHGRILLENLRGEDLDIDVAMWLGGHFDDTPVDVTISGLSLAQTVRLGREPLLISGRFNLPIDGARIRLESSGPAVHAPNDARDLRFRLTGFTARAVGAATRAG